MTKTAVSDIADFYHQLALLVQSNLPLPDSLNQLGRYFHKPEFQDAIIKISEKTARGEKLSEIIKGYPQFFPPLHVQIISAGEASGALPEALFAVARFARFGQMITAGLRGVIAYPLFTIHLSFIVLLFLSCYVVPVFNDIFKDLIGDRPLPALTEFVMSIGLFLYRFAQPAIVVYLAFLALSIWIFAPGLAAHRIMLWLINFLPGSCRIVYSLDSGRLCSMLAAFIKQGIPMPDALKTAAQLVERSALKRALDRATSRILSGNAIIEALSQEDTIDSLIIMTIRHSPEDKLAGELSRLGELFEHRAVLGLRSTTATWTIICLVLIIFIVGTVVLSMFAPLISIVSYMGK